MKKLILSFCCLFMVAAAASAREYLYVVTLPQNSEHYVIDDNVNVRANPSTDSQKLFKLNAGDRVTILSKSLADYDVYNDPNGYEEFHAAEERGQDYFYAEGYYAPWYRIRCSKGEGYICGRYVSCKELEYDFDNDGQKELLCCLTVNERKGILQFKQSFIDDSHLYDQWEYGNCNMDVNHIIIDGRNIIQICFGETNALRGGEIKYLTADTGAFTEPVTVLVISNSLRSYGYGELNDYYFYYSNGSFVPLFCASTFGGEGEPPVIGTVTIGRNAILYREEIYAFIDDGGECNHSELSESHEFTYTWNGTGFDFDHVIIKAMLEH